MDYNDENPDDPLKERRQSEDGDERTCGNEQAHRRLTLALTLSVLPPRRIPRAVLLYFFATPDASRCEGRTEKISAINMANISRRPPAEMWLRPFDDSLRDQRLFGLRGSGRSPTHGDAGSDRDGAPGIRWRVLRMAGRGHRRGIARPDKTDPKTPETWAFIRSGGVSGPQSLAERSRHILRATRSSRGNRARRKWLARTVGSDDSG